MSNRKRRHLKSQGNGNRRKGDRRKHVGTTAPGEVQFRSWMGGRFQNAIGLLDRHQRLMGFGNVATSAVIGAFVGAALALWVTYVTGKFPTPWTYMLNLASALALKVVLQWVWTIWVSPFAENQAGIFVERQTGHGLPGSGSNTSEDGSKQVQSLVTTVIAAIGVATVLVTTEDLKPAWLLEPAGVITASSSLAALTLTAEAMSTKTTIYALWKNRHQYQETRSYQKGVRRNSRPRRRKR